MEDALGSPTVIASIVGGSIVGIGWFVSPWIGNFFRRRAEEVSIAERGLSAQLEGWSAVVDRLNAYIALLQEQNARLQAERAELWEHNRKQDLALFDCEEKNRIMTERIRALELRLAQHEANDG